MRAKPRADMMLKLIAMLRVGLCGLFGDAYRPERHYMRGPGPMCRRKACSP
jgi:hypothetical protein